MRCVTLTTDDNPYDPFVQFDDWFAFDRQKGYNSCEFLGALAYSSPELSAIDQQLSIEQAIDSIVELNLPPKYRKVVRDL